MEITRKVKNNPKRFLGLPPKKKNRYESNEKWLEKREKGPEKRSEKCPKMFEPLSRLTPPESFFAASKLAQGGFLTARLCRGSHADKRG